MLACQYMTATWSYTMLFVNLKDFELYVTKIGQQTEQFQKGLGDLKCFCSY